MKPELTGFLLADCWTQKEICCKSNRDIDKFLCSTKPGKPAWDAWGTPVGAYFFNIQNLRISLPLCWWFLFMKGVCFCRSIFTTLLFSKNSSFKKKQKSVRWLRVFKLPELKDFFLVFAAALNLILPVL